MNRNKEKKCKLTGPETVGQLFVSVSMDYGLDSTGPHSVYLWEFYTCFMVAIYPLAFDSSALDF